MLNPSRKQLFVIYNHLTKQNHWWTLDLFYYKAEISFSMYEAFILLCLSAKEAFLWGRKDCPQPTLEDGSKTSAQPIFLTVCVSGLQEALKSAFRECCIKTGFCLSMQNNETDFKITEARTHHTHRTLVIVEAGSICHHSEDCMLPKSLESNVTTWKGRRHIPSYYTVRTQFSEP